MTYSTVDPAGVTLTSNTASKLWLLAKPDALTPSTSRCWSTAHNTTQPRLLFDLYRLLLQYHSRLRLLIHSFPFHALRKISGCKYTDWRVSRTQLCAYVYLPLKIKSFQFILSIIYSNPKYRMSRVFLFFIRVCHIYAVFFILCIIKDK